VFEGNERLIGQTVPIIVEEATAFTLFGRVVTGKQVGVTDGPLGSGLVTVGRIANPSTVGRIANPSTVGRIANPSTEPDGLAIRPTQSRPLAGDRASRIALPLV
jgi:hypothetical protein